MKTITTVIRHEGLTIAQRTIKRALDASYPSELELRDCPTTERPPLLFMEEPRVFYRFVPGARNKLSRTIDRRGWDKTMACEMANPQEFHAPRAPSKPTIYPATSFKGRPKAQWETRRCQSCNKEFQGKRKDHIFCRRCRKRYPKPLVRNEVAATL